MTSNPAPVQSYRKFERITGSSEPTILVRNRVLAPQACWRANPKTLLFYGAFFPQFITMDHYIGTQIAILSATFLAIAVPVDGGWALIAGHARGLLASLGHLRNKVSGGLLIGAAAALAITRNN